MDSGQILFALLRMQVCGADVGEEITNALSPQIVQDLYSLARKHDLAHIVGQALSELGQLGDDEMSQKFKKQAMLAVYRYTTLEREFQNICNALDKAQIPYMPLKGAVIRAYYPEPWMRTSCDIDVLVKQEYLDSAILALTNNLQYREGERFSYDVSLYSPSGVHLELHFDVEERKEKAISEMIWRNAMPQVEGAWRQKMSDAMFYCYHIYHMAKHMEDGGCGIKPLLDLWLLNHRMTFDAQKREDLLVENGLLTFARAAEKLSEVWFSGAEKDLLSEQLESYVLTGGVYGSMKNSMAMKNAKTGGILGFALYKIFLPYDVLKYHYPVLQKHKWLLPVCQVRRWFRLACCGKLGNYLTAVKNKAGLDEEERFSMQHLLDELGL